MGPILHLNASPSLSKFTPFASLYSDPAYGRDWNTFYRPFGFLKSPNLILSVSVYSTSMDPLLDFTSTDWGALCDLVRMLESSCEALQTGLVYCVIVEMVPV